MKKEISKEDLKDSAAYKLVGIVSHGVKQAIRHPGQEIVFNHVREPAPPDKHNPIPWQAAIGVFVFSVIVMCITTYLQMHDVSELMKITASLSFGYLFGLGTGVLHR